MGAAWLYGRSFLRRRWMLFVALGIMGGFAGGVVIASWGGARRTHSAIERFDRVTHAPHVVGPIATADQADVWLRIAALPQVDVATRLTGRALMSQQDFADGTFTFWGVVDTDAGESIGRPVLLRGRRANDDAPEEVALPESIANHWHLDVGDTLSLMSWIDGKFLSDLQADEYDRPPRRGDQGTELVPPRDADGAAVFVCRARPSDIGLRLVGRRPVEPELHVHRAGW